MSACDRDGEQLRALHAGADDYIVRPFNPDVVVARLLAILRRSGALAPERRLRVGALEVDTESYMACVRTSSGETPVSVTLVEFRLLAHMARLPNRAFTRVELLDACMADVSASTRTVDSHMSRLRRAGGRRRVGHRGKRARRRLSTAKIRLTGRVSRVA